jgi:hypothetical protein
MATTIAKLMRLWIIIVPVATTFEIERVIFEQELLGHLLFWRRAI